MMEFTLYTDVANVSDSMELDSGTQICTYKDGNYSIDIRVCGEVRVKFKGDWYKTPSEFPDELKEMIHQQHANQINWKGNPKNALWEEDSRVYLVGNNWFEMFYDDGDIGKYYNSDVVDIENMTKEKLEQFCKEVYEEIFG